MKCSIVLNKYVSHFTKKYYKSKFLLRIDVRCYDAMTGKLKKVFNEVHDEKFSVDLSTMCFGGKERKFYVGDNAGLIR